MYDYEHKYFSNEEKLLELIQNGPVVSWFDVEEFSFFRFYGGGVYYKPDVCDSYEEELIPPECAEDYGRGYTCLKDCKKKLPKHCDRYKRVIYWCKNDCVSLRFLNSERLTNDGLYGHAVTIVGYGTDR